jgi:hypothetical protein
MKKNELIRVGGNAGEWIVTDDVTRFVPVVSEVIILEDDFTNWFEIAQFLATQLHVELELKADNRVMAFRLAQDLATCIVRRRGVETAPPLVACEEKLCQVRIGDDKTVTCNVFVAA